MALAKSSAWERASVACLAWPALTNTRAISITALILRYSLWTVPATY